VAIGVLLVAIALIGGLFLLISGGDDKNSANANAVQTAQLQDKFLSQTVADGGRGISVRRPADWSQTKAHGVITLKSHDRCLAMTLSAPRAAGQAKQLRSDSVTLFRRSYKNAEVGAAPSAQVGGIPTTSDTISFAGPKGNPIRALLSVGTGQKYAYLTEVVVENPRCQGDLQLAQVVLGSIQYTK
jgi:hypothetical protein